MATQLANDFTSYELTPEEQLAGATLTATNIMNIQNLLSATAAEKLNIVIDPLNPMLHALHAAELTGRLNAYRRIIMDSLQATDDVYQQAKRDAELLQQSAGLPKNAYDAFIRSEQAKAANKPNIDPATPEA